MRRTQRADRMRLEALSAQFVLLVDCSFAVPTSLNRDSQLVLRKRNRRLCRPIDRVRYLAFSFIHDGRNVS
jgi:hypothetical protein